MAILKLTSTQNPKTSKDYKASQFIVDVYSLNLTNKINWHKQTRELVFRDVIKYVISSNKIQSLVIKL